jgi:hypothetical protein
MRFLAALTLVATVISSCGAPPVATPGASSSASPGPAAVRCVDLPETEPGLCQKMAARLGEMELDGVGTASRILVVDACPPRSECDREFLYDAVALAIPPGANPTVRAFRIFGHVGLELTVEPWEGPLPDHVVTLLAQG